ncbi:PEP-CTERM sorting domain-containing protein [Litoreibacter roseus]|uniref:Uncharacterized protein n=1 Tax=Litoreibacter roseus TaxID=2601869 RepID=A0A6N6JDB4_9RHOB|nr:PEP-CTERM sorting domain-containing protein [Litoreibacter roseus]GFE63182.1 hypothetical protein KIN_02560 [Litoreibacter roseus]
MERWITTLCAVALLGFAAVSDGHAATLLIGNTETSSIVQIDTETSEVKEFIAAGSGGLISPDDLTYGPDGNLYVSSGTNTTGQILKYDGKTGAALGVFAETPGLRRPYGVAFGPDGYMYVSSFRSDEILRFDAETGDFFDVFAAGDGTMDGLNGPNDLLFTEDGRLLVTTQGSVADASGEISFEFDSQVLAYDIETGVGEVFVQQPSPSPDSFGFVSFLGLTIGPDDLLYTSDFANGIRVYDPFTGTLLDELDTNFTGTTPSGNFIGNLAFLEEDLFFVGFDLNNGDLGSLLLATDGAPDVFLTDALLQRPIGLTVMPQPIPLPASLPLLFAGLIALRGLRRR